MTTKTLHQITPEAVLAIRFRASLTAQYILEHAAVHLHGASHATLEHQATGFLRRHFQQTGTLPMWRGVQLPAPNLFQNAARERDAEIQFSQENPWF